MRLPPLLASLTRHKLTVALMLLATAFTCAIVCNIASMIAHRLALLDAPSGLTESSVVTLDSNLIDASQFQFGSKASGRDHRARYREDIAALRGIAGVQSAVAVSGLPLEGGLGFDITAKVNAPPEAGIPATGFIGGPGELVALGLRLVRGRDFLPSEYLPSNNYGNVDKVSAAIVSRALAARLFHGANAVGHLFYDSGHPIRIVGVVDHLMGMHPELGATDNEYAMLLPLEPNGDSVAFVLRTSPKDRERVLQRAVTVLGNRDKLRIFHDAETFTQLRAQYFQSDSAMVSLLLVTGLALLVVTALGIAGLASFWVQQRTHSIGIRRAVGATRMDILCYFQTENFLIITGGEMLGCVLAYALNLLLMKYYALQVLPPWYLAISALVLWLMGQIAVLGPALRAAAVPPAVATRRV